MKLFHLSTVALAALIFHIGGAAQAQSSETKPVLQGNVVYKLPQTAVDAEIGGSVLVGVSVSDNGKPEKVWIAAGPMWPCGKTPQKALDDLSETVSATIKAASFTPAMKNGKPVSANLGLNIDLKNPNFKPPVIELDPRTGKPKLLMVSMGVLNGKALSLPRPRYPQAAKEGRHGGAVPIQVLISTEGNVTHAGALSGYMTLQGAAREAACGAKFGPTKLEGNLVKVSGVVTYSFVP